MGNCPRDANEILYGKYTEVFFFSSTRSFAVYLWEQRAEFSGQKVSFKKQSCYNVYYKYEILVTGTMRFISKSRTAVTAAISHNIFVSKRIFVRVLICIERRP